jgi:hypothetical protein
VTADYTALVLDDKLLVVKHDPGASPGHQAIGRLIDVPDNLRREFIAPTVAKNPDLADAFLPVMIDATGFRTGGYVMLALGVPAGLLAAWNLRRSLARRGRPDWHPVAKSLLRYGLQDDVARQIDDESQNPDECVTVGKLKLTKSWLLLPTTFGLKVRHLGEAVWAYKTVTKHSVNFIPTGKTYAVVCHFRDGSAETITVRSEVQSEDVVLALFQRVPWMLAGYGDDIQQAWKRNRPEVLNAVEARRQHLLNTADQQGDEAPPPDGAPADEGRDEG